MKRSGLTEFQLEEKDFKLRICRKGEDIQTQYQAATPVPFPPNGLPAMAPVVPAPAAPDPAEASAAEIDESKLIKSPMVGTFYAAPSPESPPFINVDDSVGDESVVCIIEAMKVMNEIKAEARGTIAEILVENGESVEYGQPLFRLK